MSEFQASQVYNRESQLMYWFKINRLGHCSVSLSSMYALYQVSSTWDPTSVVSAFERLKQEDYEFKASMTIRPFLETNINKKQNKSTTKTQKKSTSGNVHMPHGIQSILQW